MPWGIASCERNLIHAQKIGNWSVKQRGHEIQQLENEKNKTAHQSRCNVTDISGQLTDNEKEVLSLGPKFIIKQKPKLIYMISAIQRLRYSIEWRYCMHCNIFQVDKMRLYEREFCRPPTCLTLKLSWVTRVSSGHRIRCAQFCVEYLRRWKKRA